MQRQVRDGVDAELRSLFLQAIRAGADGLKRARFATKAFIFRSLETLDETKGCFRINARLAIAFDGTGDLEVDFSYPDARLAIELDGPAVAE